MKLFHKLETATDSVKDTAESATYAMQAVGFVAIVALAVAVAALLLANRHQVVNR